MSNPAGTEIAVINADRINAEWMER